jgi:colanic acid/amylovoran biosynthesis glycosyltransferase
LKVAYIVSLFPKISETFILREMEALKARGVDIVIYSLKNKRESVVHPDAARMIPDTLYAGSILGGAAAFFGQCIRRPAVMSSILLSILKAHITHPVLLAKSIPVIFGAASAATMLRERKVDRIHAHWATYPALAAWIINRTEGIPYSITAHAHDIFLPNPHLRDKIRGSEFSVTISEHNLDLLKRLCGTDTASRIHVVHCGIPLDQFPARSGLPREESRIVSIGRLVDYKGFPTLLEALALLRGEGRKIRCDLIGEGPMKARLLDYRKKLGLGDSLFFHGSKTQEEVRDLLRGSAAFVLASQRGADGQMDGIPVVLMEAMALGVPVVTTRISGIPEIVDDGRTGLLVEPGDPGALARAIGRILDDTSFAADLSLNGRKMVEEEFDMNHSADKILALMNGETAQ